MKQFYTNFTKLTLTLVILLASSVAGFAATILVNSGTTTNHTTVLSNTIYEVSGTLNLSPSSMSGTNKVTIYSGGVVNLSKGSVSNVQFDIRSGGTLNITVNASFSNNSGILNAGTVTAEGITFNSSSDGGLQNSGTITMTSFSISNKPSVSPLNKNTGTMTISGAFTIQSAGKYENAGTLNASGSFTASGDFINSGYMAAKSVTINSASDVTLNGSLTVTNGDLIISGNITGTNGALLVSNGTSTLRSAGSYTGTNMHFYDQNSATHDFDTNASNSEAPADYTIGQAAAASVLPLRFLSFEAAPSGSSAVSFKFVTTVESALKELQLQASADGKNYVTIEKFTPHNANGIFTYVSAKTEATNYTSYRVAVINLDGNKEYSKTVFYKPASSAATVETSIFPNPITNGMFNVKAGAVAPIIVNIYSADGKVLYNTTLNGQTQYQVQLPAAAGRSHMLIIQLIQNGSMKSFNVLNK